MHDLVHRGPPAEVRPIGTATEKADVAPLDAVSVPMADYFRRDDEPVGELGPAEDLQDEDFEPPPPAPTAVFANTATRDRRPIRFADHAKSCNIDSLAEPELRTYARQIGMSRRDAEELGLDRLRAGAKAHLSHHLSQLLD